MDLIRKTFHSTSTRYLISISEGLSWYIVSILENIANLLFNFNRGVTEVEESHSSDREVASSIPDLFGRSIMSCSSNYYSTKESEIRTWFKSLCDEQPGIMTNADVLKFCESINKSPLDMVFLVLATKMGAKKAGVFTETEWLRGMSELGISSSAQLQAKWNDLQAMLNDSETERSVYRFSFDYSRDRCRIDGNNIDIATATELISMFLASKWKYCKSFLTYLKLMKLRSMTKDQFLNVLDFSRCVTSLAYYDETAAWPVLMDEFVAHFQANPEAYIELPQFNVQEEELMKIKFSAQFEANLNGKL